MNSNVQTSFMTLEKNEISFDVWPKQYCQSLRWFGVQHNETIPVSSVSRSCVVVNGQILRMYSCEKWQKCRCFKWKKTRHIDIALTYANHCDRTQTDLEPFDFYFARCEPFVSHFTVFPILFWSGLSRMHVLFVCVNVVHL